MAFPFIPMGNDDLRWSWNEFILCLKAVVHPPTAQCENIDALGVRLKHLWDIHRFFFLDVRGHAEVSPQPFRFLCLAFIFV